MFHAAVLKDLINHSEEGEMVQMPCRSCGNTLTTIDRIQNKTKLNVSSVFPGSLEAEDGCFRCSVCYYNETIMVKYCHFIRDIWGVHESVI